MGWFAHIPFPPSIKTPENKGIKPMPKEIQFEGGQVIEAGINIVFIQKQDVEFTDTPALKTEAARIKSANVRKKARHSIEIIPPVAT